MPTYGGNFNGKTRRIVQADTKAEAARLVGMSWYVFNRCFSETRNEDEVAMCARSPNVVFERQLPTGYRRVT